MKKTFNTVYIIAFGLLALYYSACKGHATQTTTDTTTVTTTTDNTTQKTPDTAITISPDDSLRTKIADATKDFPGVSAATDQGVITLTGNITRDKLPKLMMAINSLHPKKIINNLTIQ